MEGSELGELGFSLCLSLSLSLSLSPLFVSLSENRKK
jgi:hypothetical protein